MKKLINCVTLFLIVTSFWHCDYNDCGGWVKPGIDLEIQNSKTFKKENVFLYNIKVTVGGQIWTGRNTSNPNDTLYRTFSTDQGQFNKAGIFVGKIEIDNQEVCQIEYNLIASKGCRDYPESGSVRLISGDASFSKTVISGNSIAKLVLNR